MRYLPTLIAGSIVVHAAFGAAALTAPNVTVGEHLQVIANIAMEEAAPPAGLEITVTSSDPERVKFARTPDATGSPTLKLPVRPGYRDSPEFYVHGLAKKGTVAYTASAPGFSSSTGMVTLAPSGFILARSGMGAPALTSTTGGGKIELVVYAALLDPDLNFVHPQPLAAGRPVTLKLSSSNPKVAAVSPATLTFAPGTASAPAEFHPVGPGATNVELSIPDGFTTPAQFSVVPAMVITPGMALTDDLALGYNLEAEGTVSLGEPAPAGGIVITLTSSDPSKLLLSRSRADVGSEKIRLEIPAGGVRANYHIQALAASGEVSYTGEAPGFRTRTGTVTLTPSGVVIGGPQGPPDEAELLVKEIAEGPHGFVTPLKAAPTVVTVYTVQLDPKTHRGADLTVQRVRAGAAIRAVLANSNPQVGTLESMELTIPGGSSSAVTHFVPACEGVTTVSLGLPHGYTKAANSTSLSVTVTN
jgi:hypothetical protein